MEHRGEDEDDMTRGTNDAGERATTGAARGAPSRRAHAVRNRASIIRATRRLVTERGTDAAMGEIAKAAGVAVGTLYRHFPTKADLLAAVVTQYVETLAQAIQEAWARVEQGSADAGQEVLNFVARALEMTAGNQAAKAAARTLGVQPEYSEAEARATEALERLIRAGCDSGRLRSDLTVADIYILVAFCPSDSPVEVRLRWLELIRPGLLGDGA